MIVERYATKASVHIWRDKMKRLLLIVLVFTLVVGLVGCGKKNMVKDTAQVLVDAFDTDDMATINKTIFGSNEVTMDEEVLEIWGEPDTSDTSQEGVLEQIFQYVTVKATKTTESTITYEIEAPDMKNVFVNLSMNMADISEDELLQYIKEYAKNAEKKVVTVSLKCTFVDNELIVDYRNETFINAVTGGLLDAYKALYEKMLDEYRKGVS